MLVLDNPKELSRKKIFVRIFDLTLVLQTLALFCSSPGLGSIPDTMP